MTDKQPKFFQKPAITIKNTPEFTALVEEFVGTLPDDQQPGNIKELMLLLFKRAKQAQNPEEFIRLQAENQTLQKKVNKQTEDIANLTERLSGTTTATDYNVFLQQQPTLHWLRQFAIEANSPEGIPETKTTAQLINRFREVNEHSLQKFLIDPLHILEKEEYDALKEWDEKVLLPTLAQNIPADVLAAHNVTDLSKQLTARHKFMMLLDFAMADPVGKILEHLPNLTEEQKKPLENLQFPRPQVIQLILNDIFESSQPAKPLADVPLGPKIEPDPYQQAAEITAANSGGDTEGGGGKIVELNPAGGDGQQQPAPINEGDS